MKAIGKLTMGALMLAGSSLGMTLATTAPADARVVIGIGLGGPGYYGRDPCYSDYYRYYHPDQCSYGPDWAYGDGYWFTDSFGHRSWRGHRGHWRGFSGYDSWHHDHGDHHGGGDWHDHHDHDGDHHDHGGDHHDHGGDHHDHDGDHHHHHDH